MVNQLGKSFPVKVAAGAAVGLAAVTFGAPAALGAVGFGTGGIAAGSLAAKTMSLVYTTKVGLGALSVMQSVGAVGVGAAAKAAGGALGAAVAFFIRR